MNTPALLPEGDPKAAEGRKKAPLRAVPPVALLHLGAAMDSGERKYGRFSWRPQAVTASVYYDAMMRHMLAWWDGEECAPDSGVHHLAHAMACCAILLDAASLGKLDDDRSAGAAPAMLAGSQSS